MNTTTRNVLILLAITAAVVFIPGGGRVADLIGAILSIVFAAGIAFFAGRTYLERRLDIYGLEERHRAMLYGSLAGIAIGLAAASRLLATGPGLLGFVTLFGLCTFGLFYVYQAWRQY